MKLLERLDNIMNEAYDDLSVLNQEYGRTYSLIHNNIERAKHILSSHNIPTAEIEIDNLGFGGQLHNRKFTMQVILRCGKVSPEDPKEKLIERELLLLPHCEPDLYIGEITFSNI